MAVGAGVARVRDAPRRKLCAAGGRAGSSFGFQFGSGCAQEPTSGALSAVSMGADAMRSPTQVVVDAKPEALAIVPAQSAAIVVDMQNDFGSDGGMFAMAGIDISGIRKAIAPTARVLAAARRAGISVVYLKMAFRPDFSDVGGPGVPNWIKHRPLRVGEATTAPDGTASRILIRDTWNTEIVPELAPEPGDIVLYKHRYSGFYETDLDNILKSRSIKNLIFTGCTTSVCVLSPLSGTRCSEITPLSCWRIARRSRLGTA